MDKLRIKLGLNALDKKIKFTYNIEENIGDVEAFLVLSALKSIEKGIELKTIISSFTKGTDNDQYILFENKFKKLFKEDNVESFDDYLLVEKRANNIKNRQSMIHDVSVGIDSIYFEMLDKYRININGNEHYVHEDKIPNLIEENLSYFFSDPNHRNKHPKFDCINRIDIMDEPRAIPVSSEINIDFNMVFIGGDEYSGKEIVSLAKKEVKDTSLNIFNHICKDSEIVLEEIKKISNEHIVLMDDPFNNTKPISTFGDILITKSGKDIIYFDEKSKIRLLEFNLFKGIVIYVEKNIAFDEFVLLINWSKSSLMNENLILKLIPSINNQEQLSMVERYIDIEKDGGLSDSMERELISKAKFLISSKYELLSERTMQNILHGNFKDISLEDSYKLISKHYKENIFGSYESPEVKRFLFRVDKEKSNIISSLESKIVRDYMNDKENIKEQLQILQGKAGDVRTRINKIIEDKGSEITDSKYDKMQRNIVKYLNVVNHITEDHDSKRDMIKQNPELWKWIEIVSSNYDYDLLDGETPTLISNKLKEFESMIIEIDKHIEESIQKKIDDEIKKKNEAIKENDKPSKKGKKDKKNKKGKKK